MAKKGPVIDLLTWQEEVARRVSDIGKSASATLRFDKGASTAYTDGRTITCPLPPIEATFEDYQVLRGQIIHEVGHLMRPEVFTLIKKNKISTKSKLGTLLNQIEDRVQEALVASKHKGDAISLDRLHSITARRQMQKLATEGIPDGSDTDTIAKLWGAMFVGIAGAKWMTEARRAAHSMLPIMRRMLPESLDWIDTLTREGWGQRINTPASVQEVYELSKELHKRLFPEDEPKDQPQEVEENPVEVQGGGTVPWWMLTLTDHDEDTNRDETEGHPSRIDWTGKEYNDRVPDLATDVKVFTKFSSSSNAYASSIRNAMGEGKFPASLVGEVRRRLQAKTRCRWRNEKLEGRLDIRSVGRLIMPQVGDGTYNRSVFKKKEPGLKLDVSVGILVDSSGSMSGPKYVNACISAMALNELCQRALRVPSEIIGFTHHCGSGCPQLLVHKPFSTKAISKDKLASTMGSATVNLSGNSDAEAVMFAVERLRKQTTARKVLIVLSDGAPADSKHHSMSDAYDNLKKIISLVRKAGDVELYGIGIADTNVRQFYSANAPVVNDSQDIAPALLNVLSDVLQKRPDGGI